MKRLSHLATLVASLSGFGCYGDVCEEAFGGTCPPYGAGGAGGQGGSTSTTMTTSSSNGGGGDGGGGGMNDPGCIPSMLPAGEGVPESCGVFVKANATGSGTQASPTGDLAQAMVDVPDAKAVYICGTDTFTGSFELAGGTSVFGGLDCSGWTYAAGNRPRLAGEPDVPALTVSGPGATKLEDFDVESPDAMVPGGSSIGLLIDATTTDILRVDILARSGATGAVGIAQAKEPTPVVANGGMGMAGCTGAVGVLGGGGGQMVCQSTAVHGGLGGSGTNGGSGGSGSDGEPFGADGQGGVGETALACANGEQGAFGGSGTPGPGASADLGTLSGDGYLGPAGNPGMSPGSPGQGGGGGGGANLCTTGMGGSGPSGGGGGAGGCGGNPGNGGGGGGGSFALVSINATVSLTNVSLSSGAGGIGGAGDAGQEGMDGGEAGQAGAPSGACNGGPGGKGGRGGAGGGGRGGPSVAIAYVGAAPIENDLVMLSIAAKAAPGGAGGNGGPANIGGVGADGILELRQEWP